MHRLADLTLHIECPTVVPLAADAADAFDRWRIRHYGDRTTGMLL